MLSPSLLTVCLPSASVKTQPTFGNHYIKHEIPWHKGEITPDDCKREHTIRFSTQTIQCVLCTKITWRQFKTLVVPLSRQGSILSWSDVRVGEKNAEQKKTTTANNWFTSIQLQRGMLSLVAKKKKKKRRLAINATRLDYANMQT